jgi:CRISPR system Cascade subunit CasB
MSDDRDWRTPFLERLRRLAPPGDPGLWDRATLAELRRGLGKDASHTLIHAGRLFGGVPSAVRAQDDAVLVATLFASHPDDRGGVSLGRAMRELRDKTDSESVEKRFVRLLDCAREDLDGHLRHAVALLKAKDIAVDWADLLRRVCEWDYSDRRSQRSWANDYWTERDRAAFDDGETVPEAITVEGASE